MGVKDAEMFFGLLEQTADSDAVPRDDFVDGCLKLRGFACSLDVALLAFDLKLLRRDLAAFLEHIPATTCPAARVSLPILDDQGPSGRANVLGDSIAPITPMTIGSGFQLGI